MFLHIWDAPLYLSTRSTYKENGRLFEPSAVAASTLHERINKSKSGRQVLILDCCFSGAIAQGLTVKDDGSVNVQEHLVGKGRAILTASTSTQYSFERKFPRTNELQKGKKLEWRELEPFTPRKPYPCFLEFLKISTGQLLRE